MFGHSNPSRSSGSVAISKGLSTVGSITSQAVVTSTSKQASDDIPVTPKHFSPSLQQEYPNFSTYNNIATSAEFQAFSQEELRDNDYKKGYRNCEGISTSNPPSEPPASTVAVQEKQSFEAASSSCSPGTKQQQATTTSQPDAPQSPLVQQPSVQQSPPIEPKYSKAPSSSQSSVTLQCICRGHTSASQIITVTADLRDTVSMLRDAIVAEHLKSNSAPLKGKDVNSLTLLKVSKRAHNHLLPVNVDNIQREALIKPFTTIMSMERHIYDYWSTISEKKKNRIRVLVDWPNNATTQGADANSLPNAAAAPPRTDVKLTASSHSLQQPALVTTKQATLEAFRSEYRPALSSPYPALPLSLIHPIFAREREFMDDMNDIVPSLCDLAFLDDFANQTQHFAPMAISAPEVGQIFVTILKKYYGIAMSASDRSGVAQAVVGGHTFLTLEAPSLGANPFSASVNVYMNYVSSLSTNVLTLPVLPCLHIAIIGPFISFAGSAIRNANHKFELISLGIPLTLSPYNQSLRDMVARAFAALANTANRLKLFYARDMPTQPILHDLPYPTVYRCARSRFLVTLSLDGFAYPNGDRSKHFYIGKEESCEPVLVKFMQEYPAELYTLCEQLDCVLPVRAIESMPGGWSMIVTDQVGPKFVTLDFGLMASSESSSTPSLHSTAKLPSARPVPDADDQEGMTSSCSINFLRGLVELIGAAHEYDIVFGDVLRPENILFNPETGGWIFLDLEGGGCLGTARYPRSSVLETTDAIGKPVGAVTGGLVTKEHDLERLECLIQMLGF